MLLEKSKKIVFNRIQKIVFNDIVQKFLCLIKIVQNLFLIKLSKKLFFLNEIFSLN